ncbi:hypothetical protein CVT26_007849, partial [Gymnopilus dilepis]
ISLLFDTILDDHLSNSSFCPTTVENLVSARFLEHHHLKNDSYNCLFPPRCQLFCAAGNITVCQHLSEFYCSVSDPPAVLVAAALTEAASSAKYPLPISDSSARRSTMHSHSPKAVSFVNLDTSQQLSSQRFKGHLIFANAICRTSQLLMARKPLKQPRNCRTQYPTVRYLTHALRASCLQLSHLKAHNTQFAVQLSEYDLRNAPELEREYFPGLASPRN